MNENEKPQSAPGIAGIKRCVPGAVAGGAVGAAAALTLRHLGIGADFSGPVWEVLGAWGAVCGLGIALAFGRLTRESLPLAILAGAGLSALKLYLDAADTWMLITTLCVPMLAGLVLAAGSIKLSWKLRGLRYGKEYDVPRRAAEKLGKSKAPRVISALVKRIRKGTATLDAFDALVAIGAPAVGPLIELLTDKDVNRQSNAAEALGRIGDPRAVKPLITLLDKEGVTATRTETVRALGKIGDAESIRRLLAELQLPREECKWEAIRALAETRNPGAVEPLIELLRDEAWSVRRSAVWALEKMGDARAIPPLVPSSHTDQEIEVRQSAAKALHTLGWQPDSPAMEADLAFALRDWDALVKLGGPAVPRLIEELGAKELELRRKVITALGDIRDARAIEPLITCLGPGDNDAALYALAQIGPEAGAPLADVLRRHTSRVRAAIAATLGRLGAAGIEGLRIAVEDPDADVQQAAASLLGANDDPRSSALLEECFRSPANAHLRQSAVRSLGLRARGTTPWGASNSMDINALGALVEAMGDKEVSIRDEATKSLQSWASEVSAPSQRRWEASNETEKKLITLAGAIVALIKAVSTPSTSPSELTNAIRALGTIGDRRAIGYLTLLLDNENEGVRFEVAAALSMLGQPVDVKALEKARLDRLNEERAIQAALLGKRIEQLAKELSKGDWDGCCRAAGKLSRIEDPRALESLKEAFKSENAIVRQAVVVALGEAGNKRAAELLMAARQDKDREVRLSAERALVRCGITTDKPIQEC